MLFGSPLLRRLVDIELNSDAARRRLERARFGNDVAYAEHLIERAIRRGRVEAADPGPTP